MLPLLERVRLIVAKQSPNKLVDREPSELIQAARHLEVIHEALEESISPAGLVALKKLVTLLELEDVVPFDISES